ncbi:MAG: hypothetical protein AB2651_22065 [Candidatus Thiodiazotropha sp.]
MREETDPEVLARLESQSQLKPVTDPAVIARLEGEEIPEFDLPFEPTFEQIKAGKPEWRQAKAALGLMTTFNPERELAILKEHYPDLTFSEDAEGRVIADGSAYGGNKGYINAPGISLRDLAKVGFQIAAFTPAAKAGTGMTNIAARMGTVGAASGGTQIAQDLGNQALGGEEETSIKNVDIGDVAFAALGGTAFEGIAIAASMLPIFKRSKVITDEIRNEFKAAAIAAGGKAEAVTDDVIAKYLNAARKATSDEQIRATAAQSEFGIPYTKGQATGSAKQLDIEDTFRHSQVSPGASRRMQAFDEVQNTRIEAAKGELQTKLGGEQITRPNQSGAMVREGVQGKAAALDDQIGQAYDSVTDAYLSADGVNGLLTRMKSVTKSLDWQKGELAPASSKLLAEINNFQKMFKKVKGIKPFHIKRLESMRRNINAKVSSAANPTDKRQVMQLKNEFDKYLDDAVDNALFSGDETALKSIKEARGLRAEYGRKFQRNDARTRSGRPVKDVAGDVIEKMISGNMTDEQVANYLFGASKLGGNNVSAPLAQRLKTVFGELSPEWASIRQASFLKLMQPGNNGKISGNTILTRLNEATKGSGETFMKEIFTPQEIGTFYRFANAVKQAQPGIGNPSKTAYKTGNMIRQTMEQIASSLGFATGGPAGAVAAKVALRGGEGLSGWKQSLRAGKAVKGPIKPRRAPAGGQFGAVGGMGSTREFREESTPVSNFMP